MVGSPGSDNRWTGSWSISCVSRTAGLPNIGTSYRTSRLASHRRAACQCSAHNFPRGNRALKVAILDDYQNVALSLADWSSVASRAEITVFNDHVADPGAVVQRLLPFDAICVMRERTPLPRNVLENLPRLKLIASTGPRNSSIDAVVAKERGIHVPGTGYRSTPTIELTWALILASARHIVRESNSVRSGGWQTSVG